MRQLREGKRKRAQAGAQGFLCGAGMWRAKPGGRTEEGRGAMPSEEKGEKVRVEKESTERRGRVHQRGRVSVENGGVRERRLGCGPRQKQRARPASFARRVPDGSGLA
jgi:hypothetical protein